MENKEKKHIEHFSKPKSTNIILLIITGIIGLVLIGFIGYVGYNNFAGSLGGNLLDRASDFAHDMRDQDMGYNDGYNEYDGYDNYDGYYNKNYSNMFGEYF